MVCLCALGEDRFGPEFTFTNPTLQAQHGIHIGVLDAQEAFRRHMESACRGGGCTVTQDRDRRGVVSYRVTYPDGWYYNISVDQKVVEVTTKPGTRADFREMADRIRGDIFGAAAAVGLLPHPDRGGGHIHIDAGRFDRNPLLLRNFLVDFYNHPEVAVGILRHRPSGQAIHLAELPEPLRRVFHEIIAEFDAARAAGKGWTAVELARQIHERVHVPHVGREERAHRFAINLGHFIHGEEGQRTLEIRAVRPQADVETFLAALDLLEGRLDRLESRGDVVPVNRDVRMPDPRFPRATLARVARYLADTGFSLDGPVGALVAPQLRELATSCPALWAQMSRLAVAFR